MSILGTGFMKTLLIVLFIILFIYLIIHMCAGSGERDVRTSSDKGVGKTMAVLDGLESLDDKDLVNLKDELWELKSILDSKRPAGEGDKRGIRRAKPGSYQTRSGKETLKQISKDLKRIDGHHFRSSGNTFSKFRIIFVEIALIVITILMIVL